MDQRIIELNNSVKNMLSSYNYKFDTKKKLFDDKNISTDVNNHLLYDYSDEYNHKLLRVDDLNNLISQLKYYKNKQIKERKERKEKLNKDQATKLNNIIMYGSINLDNEIADQFFDDLENDNIYPKHMIIQDLKFNKDSQAVKLYNKLKNNNIDGLRLMFYDQDNYNVSLVDVDNLKRVYNVYKKSLNYAF